jgi:hypothetical protein
VTIPLEPWVPLDPVEVRQVMATYERPWWIAGGWALDMYLGRKTRDHADIDVEVLRADQAAVQAQLRGWELYLASDGVLSPWTAGAPVPADTGDVWCRPEGSTSWALQFMLNPGTDEHWGSKRSPLITMPMARAVRRTGDGLPYLAPECQLLMKAKGLRPKDEVDFDVVLPALDGEQRTWLADALERAHPGHAWIERL